MSVSRPSLVGLNHIALEVEDVEEALRFYESVFEFELRGSLKDDQGRLTMAFIDMGDQFLALSGGRTQPPDTGRHFGLVVDDRSRVMDLAKAAGAKVAAGDFNFLDPWGNHIEVVAYRDVQFSKRDEVLRAMGLDLEKSEEARKQLREKMRSGEKD
ncbi:VOC family protein [Beijerinckia sp. L45]|uniref:VOC family protein n=1 Tax=Beijerinckia sp. L45 TaxID=1641855 RepID=UPI00131AB6FE|nr:VOC family protein [Beijerinckia sp. L45]